MEKSSYVRFEHLRLQNYVVAVTQTSNFSFYSVDLYTSVVIQDPFGDYTISESFVALDFATSFMVNITERST